jgi:hypothetical protein
MVQENLHRVICLSIVLNLVGCGDDFASGGGCDVVTCPADGTGGIPDGTWSSQVDDWSNAGNLETNNTHLVRKSGYEAMPCEDDQIAVSIPWIATVSVASTDSILLVEISGHITHI